MYNRLGRKDISFGINQNKLLRVVKIKRSIQQILWQFQSALWIIFVLGQIKLFFGRRSASWGVFKDFTVSNEFKFNQGHTCELYFKKQPDCVIVLLSSGTNPQSKMNSLYISGNTRSPSYKGTLSACRFTYRTSENLSSSIHLMPWDNGSAKKIGTDWQQAKNETVRK